MSDKRSALNTLSAAEKAAVLDELLAARPDLREPAEAYAVQVMTDTDRSAVADDVEDALQGLDIEELNTRAGHRPGRGYVHPAEAADEILQPFLDDLQRRAHLGVGSAAVELAAGILLGLYNCRHGNSETLLEYSPDYAAERASAVVSDCAKLGIELPGRPGLRRLLVSYFFAASLRCQASRVAGATGKTSAQRLRGTSRASAANQARSAASYRTRPACRRSTAFSCRSTSSSASFARSPRNTRTARPSTRHVSK